MAGTSKGRAATKPPRLSKKYSRVVLCRGVLFSGNANNGANAGFVYANTNNTATNANANIGSQRCLKKYKSCIKGDLATKTPDSPANDLEKSEGKTFHP